MSNDTGGPAFPYSYATPNEFRFQSGMTLRDWFAGQALAGIAVNLSNDNIQELADGIKGGNIITEAAYAIADSMISKRSKP